jgi:phytoene dehydrogenase-like protein
VGTNKYDIAVIGSGIGGVCAAALLAHRGYRIIMVESLGRLGGRFSTVDHQGFKITTGALGIPAKGVVEDIFRTVKADFDVSDVSRSSLWIDGKWYELPQKGQISFLLSLVNAIGEEKAKLVGRFVQRVAVEKIKSAFSLGAEHGEDLDDRLSFRDWLKQYTDNERVLQVFASLTSAMSTVNDFEYPAAHWFAYISKRGQGGITHFGCATRGNVNLANSLASTVTARGGDVWTDCPAKKIVVKNGLVAGMVVERNGRDIELSCKAVISDVGPKRTVELAGTENFDANYLAEVRGLKATPIVVSMVASDKPLFNGNSALLIAGARRIVAGFPISNICPELVPAGQHLLHLWGTPASCSHKMDVDEEIKLNLEDIKEVFPEFEKHGRILKTETHDIDDEFPAMRSWMGYDLKQATPVANLYNVGDGVKPFGWEGLAACAQGAKLVVDNITKRVKPGK